MKHKKIFLYLFIINLSFIVFSSKYLSVASEQQQFSSGFGANLDRIGSTQSDTGDKAKEVLGFIPGLGAFADLATTFQFLSYLGFASKNSTDGEINIMALLSSMSGFDTEDSTNFPAKLALQTSFNTNDYCTDQQLYIEENDYISKQVGGTVGNSYGIFPVFPINSRVTGNLCDIDAVVENFKHDLSPSHTKCSYNYNTEDDACILEGALPVIIIDYIDLVVGFALLGSTGCASTGGTAKVATKASKAKTVLKVLEAGIKVFSAVSQALTTGFSSDPLTYVAKRAVAKTYEFIIFDSLEIGSIIAESLASQNYGRAAYCPFVILTMRFLSLPIMRAAAQTWSKANYDRAEKEIRNTKFCGYDWFTWSNDYDYNDNNKNYIIPKLGINDNSRYKAIYECIKYGEKDSSKCQEKNLNTDYCEYSCDNIAPYSRDVRNRNYREFSLLGKEIKVINKYGNLNIERIREGDDNRAAAVDYDFKDCIDPRLPAKKGFETLDQRYYMRGNEKGNYQCNRFFYDGNGCVLNEKFILDQADKQNQNIKKISHNNSTYYLLDPRIQPELVNKYYSACNKAFQEARKCCKKRSETFVCLEDIGRKEEIFCMSNILEGKTNISYSNFADYFKRVNKDDSKITCKLYNNRELEGFEVSKKRNTNYICVFSKGFCPFNFRLNGGLNYKASFCDSSVLTADQSVSDESFSRSINHFNKSRCQAGFFYNENEDAGSNKQSFYINTTSKEYNYFSNNRGYTNANYNLYFFYNKIAADMEDFNKNDFEIIYKNQETKKMPDLETEKLTGTKNLSYVDFNKYDNGNVYKIKNFCQYRAHCVEVEREQSGEDSNAFGVSLFMDSSCNGKSRNSRTSTNVSLLGFSPIKQLSSPIVECVYESLSNLVKGIAGNSLCTTTSNLNSDGYCDGDTEEDIKRLKSNNATEELSSKYRKLDGEYIIKGYRLPYIYNPFVKLQTYLLKTVKAMMVLFLCLFGFLKLINGKLDDIKNAFISGTLSTYIINLAFVMWLGLGGAMYNVVFDKLKNLTMGAYLLMNELVLSSLQTKNYLVLKQDNKVRRVKLKIKINLSNQIQNYSLCYTNTRTGNILFKAKKADGSCPFLYRDQNDFKIYTYTGKDNINYLNSNLTLRHNQAIQNLLYFIDMQNSRSMDEIFLVGINDNGEEIGRGLNNIDFWNENYDGCFFSTYEYKAGKEYLSIFDMLDCKTSRYLGFVVGEGLPNLFILAAMMMMPDLLSGAPIIGGIMNLIGKLVNAIGTFFLGMMMTFFFAFMNLTIKIIFIFISSFFNLSILLFLTPIIIPFLLFEKTKGKFDVWFKQIVGAVFSPVFSITFTIILLNILDIFLYNGVYFESFKDSGRLPVMVCPANTTNVLCFIQEIPVFGQLKTLFTNFSLLLKLVFNLFIAYFIISAGESIIDELKSMLENLISIDGATSGGELNGDISGTKLSSSFASARGVVGNAQKVVNAVVREPLSVVARGAEKYENAINNRYDNAVKMNDNFHSKYEGLKSLNKIDIDNYRKTLTDEKAKAFDKDIKDFEQSQSIIKKGRSEALGRVGNILNPGEAAKEALAEYDAVRGEKYGLGRTIVGVADKLFRGEFKDIKAEIDKRRKNNDITEIERLEGMMDEAEFAKEEEEGIFNFSTNEERREKIFKEKAKYESKLEIYLREHKEELDNLKGKLNSTFDEKKKESFEKQINEINEGAERIEVRIKELEQSAYEHTREGKIEKLEEHKDDIGR